MSNINKRWYRKRKKKKRISTN